MFERLPNRRTATIAAAGTESTEIDFGGCYPVRVYVQNTTGAPTSIGLKIADPLTPGSFVDLYSGGSALAIAVTPGKWVDLTDVIPALININVPCKAACSAWSAGGKIVFDTST